VLRTASSLVGFYSSMEEALARFYEELARREEFSGHREALLALSGESLRHRDMVQRAYREGVTDAYEVGYMRGTLDEGDYTLDTELKENMTGSDLVRRAVELEETSRRFCLDAARSSGELLADLPHTFERVARRKGRRIEELESLLP